MRTRYAAVFSCVVASCALLLGCRYPAGVSVHVHDRDSASFLPIYRESQAAGPLTLVHLDYHHDAGPGADPTAVDRLSADVERGAVDELLRYGVTSYNWVGALIVTGAVERVIWVSGNDLLPPNIQARQAWLADKTSGDPPSEREAKRKAVEVWTWEDLLRRRGELRGHRVAATLDLDLLTVDPGGSPDAFLSEILVFLREIRPRVLTLALSAEYQTDAAAAWLWLTRAYTALYAPGSTWLQLGPAAPNPESQEELDAWARWERRSFSPDFGSFFARGPLLWAHAPEPVWQAFHVRPPLPGDDAAAAFLHSFHGANDPDMREIRGPRSQRELERWAGIARSTVLRELENPARSYDEGFPVSPSTRGIAVRFSVVLVDRGCFAYYTGVEDMDAAAAAAAIGAGFHDPRYPPLSREDLDRLRIEITRFGEFVPMAHPLDFHLGVDALLLETSDVRVLLQPSLARERGLSQIQFLETLTRKAGLAPGVWREPGVKLFKAPALYSSAPFTR